MTKVSIIVPAYNVEKYIARCIDSLLSQTLTDIEIIIINDGSTDKTDEIINSYLPEDRIKYFKRTNHGIGNTRNFGLKEASGEYIGFVDSDDYVEDNMFEELYKKANMEDLDLVVCDFYRNFEETQALMIEKILGFEDGITSLKKSPQLINLINLSPWNKLYKKNMINVLEENFCESLKYEDTPFVIRMIDKANKIGKVDLPLYHYAVHKNSETTVIDKRVFDLFSIFDIIRLEHANKDYLQDELNYFIVQRLSDYNIQQRNQKDKFLREKFIDMSFAYLSENVENYKQNKYYKDLSLLKRIIEKNIVITKLYCNIYAWLKNRN